MPFGFASGSILGRNTEYSKPAEIVGVFFTFDRIYSLLRLSRPV